MRKLFFIFASIVAALSTGCGKTQFKEFSPPEGRFSILMYGKPRKEEMHFGSSNMTMYGNASDGEEYAAGYADLPQGLPDFMLATYVDGVVNSFSEGNAGSSTSRSGVSNGMGSRDFEFSSPKYGGSVCGRVLVARGRIYLCYAGGKDARFSNPVVQSFIDSFKLSEGPTPGKNETNTPSSPETPSRPGGSSSTASTNKPKPPASSDNSPTTTIAPTPADPGTTVVGPMPGDPGPNSVIAPEPGNPGVGFDPPMPPGPGGRPGRGPNRPNRADQPQMVGFGIGPEFQDSAPEGALLVGFDIGFGYAVNSNDDIIIALRPIYRAGEKDQFGQIHGTDTRRGIKDLAKPGYAVGAIHAKGGLYLDGFYITYMKIVGKQLDPNDAYNSIWLGGSGGHGNAPTTMGGDGRFVVGTIGRTNEKDVKAVGLEFGPASTEALPVPEKPKPPPAAPRIPKCARFIGGWNDPEFRDESPAGGLLVGFDIAPGGAFGTTIATVRPIYQVKGKDKDVFGQMHGTDTKKGVKERAKAGYAVGGISVKGGLWVDGLSITYMKVVEDKLDPTDRYESNWYGNGNGNDASIITSEGEPVIGILGRQGRKDLNALGLLFKTPESKPAEEKKPAEPSKPADPKKQ